MSLLWILEKPTSAYAIFVSFALMAASILGTVMTLLEDHIIIVIKPNATGATPATAPSPAKEMAELSPSPSSGDSCPNEGQSMAIIAFLLFGCKCSVVLSFHLVSFLFFLFATTRLTLVCSIQNHEQIVSLRCFVPCS